jgi:hypothetical protein
MNYKVVFSVGYRALEFDFESMTEASKFAETILDHGIIPNEEREYSVQIKLIPDKDE